MCIASNMAMTVNMQKREYEVTRWLQKMKAPPVP